MESKADYPRAEKRLGEVALVVKELQPMVDFYRDVIQLTLLRLEEHMAFFEIAPGYQGHTSVLALFARDHAPAGTSSLDHIAFTIDLKDYESEKNRLTALGQAVRTSQHNWVQWRSLYVMDPDNNEVELVCFDPSIPKNFES